VPIVSAHFRSVWDAGRITKPRTFSAKKMKKCTFFWEGGTPYKQSVTAALLFRDSMRFLMLTPNQQHPNYEGFMKQVITEKMTKTLQLDR